MAVLANDQPIEAQLRKTAVPGGDARREHVSKCAVHRLDDLALVEILVSATGVGMSVRRAEHHLRKPEFLFTGCDQMLAGVDAEIDGNKRQAFAAHFEYQRTGVDRVVNRLFRILRVILILAVPARSSPRQICFSFAAAPAAAMGSAAWSLLTDTQMTSNATRRATWERGGMFILFGE